MLTTCSDMTVSLLALPLLVLSYRVSYVQYGLTPVLRAAFNGHPSIIELLVDQYHCSLTDVDNVSALDVLQCSHVSQQFSSPAPTKFVDVHAI